MDKRDVKRAFRAAMALEFAAVPATEDAVTYSFTQGFCRRMEALIAERKRGSWRLLRKRARRVLVAAVLVVLLALLVACPPKLRIVVKDFVVSFTDRDANFEVTAELREEIRQLYWLAPVPEGFMLVEQKQSTPTFANVKYRDERETELTLIQVCGKYHGGSADVEQSRLEWTVIGDKQVWFWKAPNAYMMQWVQDGYLLELHCGNMKFDPIADYPPEQMIACVSVMEQAAQ